MDCREQLMRTERELAETKAKLTAAQAKLATTQVVLAVVIGELTEEQFGRARETLDLKDLLSSSDDSAV